MNNGCRLCLLLRRKKNDFPAARVAPEDNIVTALAALDPKE